METKNLLLTLPLIIFLFIGIAASSLFDRSRQAEATKDAAEISSTIDLARPSVATPWHHKRFEIVPRYEISFRARVVARDVHHLGRESRIAPVELLVAWGPVADPDALSRLAFRRSQFHYSWVAATAGFDNREVASHTANLMLIPSDDRLMLRLKALRPLDLVGIQGTMVDVHHPDGWVWRSSDPAAPTQGKGPVLIWLERLSERDESFTPTPLAPDISLLKN